MRVGDFAKQRTYGTEVWSEMEYSFELLYTSSYEKRCSGGGRIALGPCILHASSTHLEDVDQVP